MWNVQKYFDENQIEYVLRGTNYFVRCLWHAERSGSLAVSRDGKAIYCFGCGERGAFLKYVQKATPQVNIIEYVDSKQFQPKRFVIQDKNEEIKAKRHLHETCLAQLELYKGEKEAVTPYLTGALKTGHDQIPIYFSEYSWALYFPVYQYDKDLDEDVVVGIQRRHLLSADFDELGFPCPQEPQKLNARPKWQISKNFTKSHHLYGYTKEAINTIYEGIVLVEGIRDKVAGQLLYPQYLWLATFGCHLSKVQKKKILAIHKNRPVIMGYDTDKAGLEGSKDAATSLVGAVLLRRGIIHGAKDMGALTEITEERYFEISPNIAPLFK